MSHSMDDLMTTTNNQPTNQPTNQPHCSAMGGAATPHIKITDEGEENDGEDRERKRLRKSAHERAVSFACMQKVEEKDKIFNLRPLKKIESVDGRTILYEPSSPKDIAL